MTPPRAAVLLGPGEGTEGRIAGDRFLVKGDVTQRTEAFAVVEYTGAPAERGPPLHVHLTWEEAWFVLEGKVKFTIEKEEVLAGPGTYLLVPRGVRHAFEVAGRAPAKWLGIFSPGKYVGLIEEIGAIIPSAGPPDMAKVAQLFARYDSELV